MGELCCTRINLTILTQRIVEFKVWDMQIIGMLLFNPMAQIFNLLCYNNFSTFINIYWAMQRLLHRFTNIF